MISDQETQKHRLDRLSIAKGLQKEEIAECQGGSQHKTTR